MSGLDGAEEAAELAKQFAFLENTLLKNRTLTIFGEITQAVAQRSAERLLALSFESDDPITLFIGSPGGHVESGDTVFDMIRYIKPTVRTVGTGWVGSIATHIYLAADKEKPVRVAEHAVPHSPAGRRVRRGCVGHRDPCPGDREDPGADQPDHRGTDRPAPRARCSRTPTATTG